ncbi:site-specific integrase [Sneathiella aquimaris]|uniref:site-specific integrase n=1 Tax=Sneathiella aquimaris TaxID=2599305 RepID=UPI00146B64AB
MSLTPGGLNTNFDKTKDKPLKKGLVGKGLTIHGLRTTVATRLAEAGCTPAEIKAIIGHASDASIRVYTEEANKRVNADAAILKWEQRSNKDGKF